MPSKFKRLPTKPTSISRSRNPVQMKCNRGNFQCGATCKPIKNKRTGNYTNCPSNKALGMAQTGLAWVKDREERLGKVNDRRIAKGKSKLKMSQGRLEKPEPKQGYQPINEWEQYLSERGLSRTAFNMLPRARQKGLERGYSRSMRELRAAEVKIARDEARNQAIAAEVSAQNNPPAQTPVKSPPRPKLKEPSKRPKEYRGKSKPPTPAQKRYAEVILSELTDRLPNNPTVSATGWVAQLKQSGRSGYANYVSQVLDAVKKADPIWVLNNKNLLKISNFKRNVEAIGEQLGVGLEFSERRSAFSRCG